MADALHRQQIFDRLREAVERPHDFAAMKLGVALLGLSKEGAAVLLRDDSIDLRIELRDVVEIGRHNLDARYLSRLDGVFEGHRVHHYDIGHLHYSR